MDNYIFISILISILIPELVFSYWLSRRIAVFWCNAFVFHNKGIKNSILLASLCSSLGLVSFLLPDIEAIITIGRSITAFLNDIIGNKVFGSSIVVATFNAIGFMFAYNLALYLANLYFEVFPPNEDSEKTVYVSDTVEINEVEKLERKIKIKKLQKELKELEEE